MTGTRAEYGLLEPLICELNKDAFFDVRIAVTGTHLSKDYGLTYQAIESDGYPIDCKIEILPEENSPNATAIAMSNAIERFSEYFDREKPDLLVLLGDRYEAFAVAAAAVIKLVPIAHIHGGEISEGAYDDCFRHCITKMSQIHFPCCEEYRKRIIQLGEQPKRVFNVGALGIENIKKMNLLSKEALEEAIAWKLERPYVVVTFHPVTLDQKDSCEDLEEMLKAIDDVEDMQFVITKANADDGGVQINRRLQEYVAQHPEKTRLFDNLGQVNYLSAVRHCEFVLGNSSSGIIEVPAFQKPTVNIGIREKGRVQADSIINCEPTYADIAAALKKARSDEMKLLCQTIVSPFDGGETAKKIKNQLKRYLKTTHTVQKSFYNIGFQV